MHSYENHRLYSIEYGRELNYDNELPNGLLVLEGPICRISSGYVK